MPKGQVEPRIILRHAQSHVWAVCLCGWRSERFDTRRAFRVNEGAYIEATRNAWDAGAEHYDKEHG